MTLLIGKKEPDHPHIERFLRLEPSVGNGPDAWQLSVQFADQSDPYNHHMVSIGLTKEEGLLIAQKLVEKIP